MKMIIYDLIKPLKELNKKVKKEKKIENIKNDRRVYSGGKQYRKNTKWRTT